MLGDRRRRSAGLGGRRSTVYDNRSQRSEGHGKRWSDAVDHMSLLCCVGLSWSWNNVLDRKSWRCEGHGGQWSNVFDHGIILDVLHRIGKRFDHKCRHAHWRSRFGKRGGPNPATSTILAGFISQSGVVPKLSEVWAL